jgi:hypothetical protein
MGERTWDCEALESIERLVAKWRQDAQTLRRFKVEAHAELIEALLEDLQTFVTERAQETLTLSEASAISGYSKDQLRRHIQKGWIPNSCSGDQVRLQRRHLPKKPGHGIAVVPQTAPSSRTQVACAIATRED